MKLITSLVSLLALATFASAPAQAQCSIEMLPLARGGSASVVMGDLLFIAGGHDGPTVYDKVDIYDSATGIWSVATLLEPRTGLCATVVGNRALFAGGFDFATNSASDVVDVYDAALGLPSNPAAWSAT